MLVEQFEVQAELAELMRSRIPDGQPNDRQRRADRGFDAHLLEPIDLKTPTSVLATRLE